MKKKFNRQTYVGLVIMTIFMRETQLNEPFSIGKILRAGVAFTWYGNVLDNN